MKAIQQGKTLKKTITNDRSGLHSSASVGGAGSRVREENGVRGKESGVRSSERPSGNELMKSILEAKPLRKPSTGMSGGQGR